MDPAIKQNLQHLRELAEARAIIKQNFNPLAKLQGKGWSQIKLWRSPSGHIFASFKGLPSGQPLFRLQSRPDN